MLAQFAPSFLVQPIGAKCGSISFRLDPNVVRLPSQSGDQIARLPEYIYANGAFPEDDGFPRIGLDHLHRGFPEFDRYQRAFALP
jgi:hypothetical protein